MTGSDVEFTHLLEWRVGGRPFSLRLAEEHAVLTTPGAETLSLTREEWAALAKAVDESHGTSSRIASHRALPTNAGQPWSEKLDRRLVDAWRSGIRLEELALMFGRTVSAVEHRLLRLGITTARLD